MKLIKRFSLFVVLIFICTSAFSNTISSNFTDSKLTVGTGELAWTLGTTLKYIGFDGTKGVQFGSSSNPAGVFTLSASQSGTITQVDVVASAASNGGATFSLKTGETSFTSTNASIAASTTNQTITFTGSATGNMVLTVNSPSKAVYIKTITVTYTTTSGGGDTGGSTTETVTPAYSESFTGGQGKFTIENKSLPEGISAVWTQSSTYGMKATAYSQSTNHASESWLISPIIDLTNSSNAVFSFDHAAKFFTDVATMKQNATVMVRVGTGEWTQIANVNYPANTSWTYVNSGNLSLSTYNGQKIQIAFRYVSTDTNAGTWEIKNFVLTADGAELTVPEVTSIKDLKALANGTTVKLTLNEANMGGIEYVNDFNGKAEAFVRDNTGAVEFFNFLPSDAGWHTNGGGALVGSVIGQYTLYNGVPEFTAVAKSSAGDVLCLDNMITPTPKSITVADTKDATYRADYISLTDVSIAAKAINDSTTVYYAVSGTDSVRLFNQFKLSNVVMPTNPEGKTYTITGIVGAYSNKSEIYLITLNEKVLEVTLNENDANSNIISTYNGKTVNVTVKKSLNIGEWSTICLPFSINGFSDVVGSAQLARFSGYDSGKKELQFTSTADIEAGIPYLIKPSESISSIVIDGATLISGTKTVTQSPYDFIGIYDAMVFTSGNNNVLLIKKDNSLTYANEGSSVNAFRAYLKSTSADDKAIISIDGISSDIKTIDTILNNGDRRIYNLNGQYVGNDLNVLPRGIYIQNGQKVIR